MPYNGSGTFNSLGVPTFPAVTGEYILASYFNATMNDVFLGLSTALPRDGQAAMSAALAMANFKITGLGNGSNPQDAVTYSQVFSGGSFTNPSLLGVVDADGATSVLVPSPAAADDSQKAVPTSYLVDYYAPLASPTFTGIPAAPTAAYGTNTTQLATMAALQAALALLPAGALPSIFGKGTTWKLQVNATATGVEWGQLVLNGSGGRTITGNVTLTVTSGSIANAAISVTPATPGLYVTLPVATTITVAGVVQISIYNAGDYDYGVKDSAGTQLGWVRPRTGAIIGLADNSTAAGVWTPYGLEKTGITAQYNNSTATNSGTTLRAIALDANRTCFLFGDTTCYAIVYDASTQTWGTATSVRTGLASAAFVGVLSATNQVLVCTCDTTTGMEAVSLTIAGTGVTVNTGTKATATLAGNFAANQMGQLIANGTSWVLSYGRATTTGALRALTVSGTTPTIGAESAHNTSATTAPTIFTSGAVVRAIATNTATTGIDCIPYTVSGSTLTVGTKATVSTSSQSVNRSFVNGNGNIVCQYVNSNHSATIFKLTGTVEAASTVVLSSTAPTAALANWEALPITASKTLFISYVSSTWYANILTDTAGTASVGAQITDDVSGNLSGLQAINAVSNVGRIAYSTGSVVGQFSFDCSGASPVVTSIERVGYSPSSFSIGTPQTTDKFGNRQAKSFLAGAVAYCLGSPSSVGDTSFGIDRIGRSGPPLPVSSTNGVIGASSRESFFNTVVGGAGGITGQIIQRVECAA